MFDHIDGFEFSLIFLIQILGYLPLLQDGATAKFLALRRSQNRPWQDFVLWLLYKMSAVCMFLL